MSRSLRPVLLLVLLALFTGGCASVSSRKVVDLSRFQRFFVETRLNENHRLDEALVAALRRQGRVAECGPRTMMPPDTEVIVTYDARWTWDFRNYLIELNVAFHTVSPPKKLADARRYQPSLWPKPPEEVVRGLLEPLFRP
jgi:hypothetical protein